MCLSNELSCEARIFSCQGNPHRFLQSKVLRLSFPMLEPWVVESVSLPSCSPQFIRMQMWDYLVLQLLPHPPSPPAATLLHALSLPAAHLCLSYQSELMFLQLLACWTFNFLAVLVLFCLLFVCFGGLMQFYFLFLNYIY